MNAYLKQALLCLALVFLVLGMFGGAKPVSAQDNTGTGNTGVPGASGCVILTAHLVDLSPTTVTAGPGGTLYITATFTVTPTESNYGAMTVQFFQGSQLLEATSIDENGQAQLTLISTFQQSGTYDLTVKVPGQYWSGTCDHVTAMSETRSITVVGGAPAAAPATAPITPQQTTPQGDVGGAPPLPQGTQPEAQKPEPLVDAIGHEAAVEVAITYGEVVVTSTLNAAGYVAAIPYVAPVAAVIGVAALIYGVGVFTGVIGGAAPPAAGAAGAVTPPPTPPPETPPTPPPETPPTPPPETPPTPPPETPADNVKDGLWEQE